MAVAKNPNGFVVADHELRSRIVRVISDAGRSRAVSDQLDGVNEVTLLRAAIGQGLQPSKFAQLAEQLPRLERLADAYRRHKLEKRADPKAIKPFGRFVEEHAG